MCNHHYENNMEGYENLENGMEQEFFPEPEATCFADGGEMFNGALESFDGAGEMLAESPEFFEDAGNSVERGFGEENFSAFSGNIEITPFSVAPTITFPSQNATVPWGAVTLRWNLVAGASYVLAVRDITDRDDGPLVVSRTNLPVGRNNFTILVNQLGPGRRYRFALASVVNGVERWTERLFRMQVPVTNRTVTFNPNGGTPNPTTRTVPNGSTLGSLPAVSRAGFIFRGWWTATTGGTQIHANTAINSNLNLVARWEQTVRFTVNFNPNGGTPAPAARSILSGATLGALPAVSRTGFVLVGWFNTSAVSGGTQFHANTAIHSNVNLWARWRPNPHMTAPTNNAIVAHGAVPVRWNAVPGATYRLYMRDITIGDHGPVLINGVGLGSSTSFTISANLLAGNRRYRVAVVAIVGGAEGWGQSEFTIRGLELLTMQQVMQLTDRWRSVPLTDLWTGKRFNIAWHRRGDHTDWSPMAPADVQVIQSILNPTGANRNWNLPSSWSWDPRPAMVVVDGRRIAVGIHLFPHGSIMWNVNGGAQPGLPLSNQSNTQPSGGWPVGGHMCMYYSNSVGNGDPDWERRMNDAARTAHGL